MPIKLPNHVWDELCITCALKGYSNMKCGKGGKLKRQNVELEHFYHGQTPNYPNQIALLANASYSYRELYDGSTIVSIDKDDNSMQDAHTNALKDCYTRGSNVKFCTGIDINSVDVEEIS